MKGGSISNVAEEPNFDRRGTAEVLKTLPGCFRFSVQGYKANVKRCEKEEGEHSFFGGGMRCERQGR